MKRISLLLCWMLVVSPALACERPPKEGPEDWRKQVREAQGIFFGTIRSVTPEGGADPPLRWNVEFEVEHTVRGAATPQQTLHARTVPGGDCPKIYFWETEPRSGDSWIVFTYNILGAPRPSAGLPKLEAVELLADDELTELAAYAMNAYAIFFR